MSGGEICFCCLFMFLKQKCFVSHTSELLVVHPAIFTFTQQPVIDIPGRPQQTGSVWRETAAKCWFFSILLKILRPLQGIVSNPWPRLLVSFVKLSDLNVVNVVDWKLLHSGPSSKKGLSFSWPCLRKLSVKTLFECTGINFNLYLFIWHWKMLGRIEFLQLKTRTCPRSHGYHHHHHNFPCTHSWNDSLIATGEDLWPNSNVPAVTALEPSV